MSVILCTHLDNVASQATVTVSAEDTTYPIANAIDLNPQRPSKLTATTGWWKFSFAAAQRIDLISLWRNNFTAGLSVQIQGNATDAWGSPSLDTTIVIPTIPEDSDPLNPFKLLTGVTGYLISGFQYWRINIPSANSHNLAIGDIWLSNITRILTGLQWGVEITEEHPIIEHLTKFRVSLIYDLGVRLRKFESDGIINATDYATLTSWYRACRGKARAGLFIPDSSINDCWFVRFSEDGLMTKQIGPAMWLFQLTLLEVGQGLPL
jgi:hypothetical protein